MEDEISEIHQRLDNTIYELEAICGLDRIVSSNAPIMDSVMVLGRRIATTSIAPLFTRFNTEVGPLEALPSRFRVPFPTMEDFKFSILNYRHEPEPHPQPPSRMIEEQVPLEDTDEYDDDF